jgi:hypothetical protein|tara:strand:+ start:456 stop:746 length:291 start_codon:yes stop_codon:yes gene_type:complete
MSENQSIKETLDIIRKALEEDEPLKISEDYDNVLILNQLVRDDGTINILKENSLTKKDTIEILDKKLDEIFDNYLTKWLDKNIPNYLEKYFKKKDI